MTVSVKIARFIARISARWCTRRRAHEQPEITNLRGLPFPLLKNTGYVTAGFEEPERATFCATPCARRAALQGANMEQGAKWASS